MKYLRLVFLLILISCNQKDSGININKELVKPFFRNETFNPEDPRRKFEEVIRYTIDLNNNNHPDTIILRIIKDWPDAGDFHQIEIILDNKEKKIETNFDGWVKFGQNYPVNDYLRKLNKLKSDLILVTEFNTNRKLIFAFGWVYASEPGFLSVFEANGKVPQMIFNDNFEIQDLNQDSFVGEYHDKIKTIKLINNRLDLE